jgi:hypothetical protein
MNLSSRVQTILSKIKEFYRINPIDSDDRVKSVLRELFHQWPDVLTAVNDASDDELFALNVSRGLLSHVFFIVLSKDCFINDRSFALEILRTCFDLLVNHIDIFTNDNSTSIAIFLISNLRLIMEMLSHLVSTIRSIDIDLIRECDHQLLIAMRHHIDRDYTNDNLTDDILSLIWNISDNTTLVPLLINTGYAQSLVEWIKVRQNKFRIDKQEALIFILQNMSRHDDAIDQFNIYNVLDLIEQIRMEPNIHNNEIMLMQVAMIKILLTDTNQIQLDSIKFLTMIFQLTIDAAENEKYRYDGSHVCEPLTVLAKLFHNEHILHIILHKIETKSSLTTQLIIELFASLIIKFYPILASNNDSLENFTCVLVFNILCLISSHYEYCRIIGDHEQLMYIIKNAANNKKTFVDTFMPRTMKSIQQAALNIVRNLVVNNITSVIS